MEDTMEFNVRPYKAAGFTGGGAWFNSPPLKLADLKGKVVLVDFWTYSCINCIRSLPYLQAWYDAYKRDGFIIIGVHSPEFEFEKISANVERAIKDRKLTYPIVQDNDLAIWSAYSNHYWPAHYLIDKDGYVRREHFGEGEYDQTEKAIRALLAEAGKDADEGMTIKGPVQLPIEAGQSPETYLGYERGRNFVNASQFKADNKVAYTVADNLDENDWSLGGTWTIGAEGSHSEADGDILRFKFSSKEVYLVMGGPNGARLR